MINLLEQTCNKLNSALPKISACQVDEEVPTANLIGDIVELCKIELDKYKDLKQQAVLL